MSTVLADPAEMIAHGAPHVIHNDAELQEYTDALFQLTALARPSRYQVEAIELLTLLVERYEQEHYSIPPADPVSVVRFLIEQNNLTQRDLIPQFGSESAVSMFLGGQRNLTIEQVRKLSIRFKLPADIFIAAGDKRNFIQAPPEVKTFDSVVIETPIGPDPNDVSKMAAAAQPQTDSETAPAGTSVERIDPRWPKSKKK